MNSMATLNAAVSNFSKQGMFNKINNSTSIRAFANGVLGDYLADGLTGIPGGKTHVVAIVS
jgi:hypothetical protein